MFVDAQSFYRRRRNRDFVVSFGTGTASYFGELNNPKDRFDTKLNIEFGLEYKFHPRISPKVMLTIFQLEGTDTEADDPSRQRRNLRFRSTNIELSAVGLIQFIEDPPRYYQRANLNGYVFGGIGVVWYNPKADIPDEDYLGNPFPDAGSYTALRPLQTELTPYGSVALVIPFGIGGRYKVNPWFNISLEAGYRLTFTDYLDDVSGTHPGPAAFTDPLTQALSDRRPELDLPPAPAGTDRGNAGRNDGYFIWNIQVEYYLQSLFGMQTGATRRRGSRRR